MSEGKSKPKFNISLGLNLGSAIMGSESLKYRLQKIILSFH